MDTFKSLALEIIPCDLCKNATQFFCNSCQNNLCLDCVSKHISEFLSLPHRIVSFSERKIQLILPECLEHHGKRCESYCKKCDVPVCLRCISKGSHKRHSIENLIENIDLRKRAIENETQEIETKLIPRYKGLEADAEKDTLTLRKEFDEKEKEQEYLRVLWHKEVDTIFDTLGLLNITWKDNNLALLKTYKSTLRKTISEMHQTVGRNNQLIKSCKVSEVNSYASSLLKYRNVPEKQIKIPTFHYYTDQGREYSFVTEDFSVRLTQTLPAYLPLVSYLMQSESFTRPRVLATIGTQCNSLYAVACIEDEVWVSGQNKIKLRFDINGSVKDCFVTTFQNGQDDISVSLQGQLMYTDLQTGKINIVNQGRPRPLLTPPKDWTLNRLCCTKSGDILVHVNNVHPSVPRKAIRNKVIRYRGQKIIQEIDKDSTGNAFFGTGYHSLHMTENHNGDICVSDCNSKIVVALENAERVRFRYDGTQARKENAFYPRYLVTDDSNQIIISDFNNDCLHIITQTGHLVTCVDNCGLHKPCGLSVDTKGRLWVGLYESKKIKVIEYCE